MATTAATSLSSSPLPQTSSCNPCNWEFAKKHSIALAGVATVTVAALGALAYFGPAEFSATVVAWGSSAFAAVKVVVLTGISYAAAYPVVAAAVAITVLTVAAIGVYRLSRGRSDTSSGDELSGLKAKLAAAEVQLAKALTSLSSSALPAAGTVIESNKDLEGQIEQLTNQVKQLQGQLQEAQKSAKDWEKKHGQEFTAKGEQMGEVQRLNKINAELRQQIATLSEGITKTSQPNQPAPTPAPTPKPATSTSAFNFGGAGKTSSKTNLIPTPSSPILANPTNSSSSSASTSAFGGSQQKAAPPKAATPPPVQQQVSNDDLFGEFDGGLGGNNVDEPQGTPADEHGDGTEKKKKKNFFQKIGSEVKHTLHFGKKEKTGTTPVVSDAEGSEHEEDDQIPDLLPLNQTAALPPLSASTNKIVSGNQGGQNQEPNAS